MALAFAVGMRAAAAWAAPAASVAGEVFAGGGYDTNPFLQVAATPASPTYARVSGGFLRVAPVIVGSMAGEGYRLDVRYDADVRLFGGWLMGLQQAALSLILPELGKLPMRLQASGSARRYDTVATTDNVTLPALSHTGVALDVEVLAPVARGLKLAAGYRFDYRMFDAASQLGVDYDVANVPEVRLLYRRNPLLDIETSITYLALRSRFAGQSAGALDRVSVGVDVHYRVSDGVVVNGGTWFGGQWLEGLGWSAQAGGAAGATVTLNPRISLVVRYQVMVSGGHDPASSYSRHLIMVGVQARDRLPRELAAPPAVAVAGELTPQIEDTRVRFKVRAPDAREVRVVGSWNGWRAGGDEQRLAPAQPNGLWEGSVEVGRGAHRYRFVVDGHAIRPEDAPRYIKDDFGGEDGYLEIP